MTTTIPRMPVNEMRAAPSGVLIIRLAECARRLEQMPHAGWLRLRYDDLGTELLARKSLGWLSPGLCGIWDHLLTSAGPINRCTCHLT